MFAPIGFHVKIKKKVLEKLKMRIFKNFENVRTYIYMAQGKQQLKIERNQHNGLEMIMTQTKDDRGRTNFDIMNFPDRVKQS